MSNNLLLKYCDPDTVNDVAVRDLFIDEILSVRILPDVIILPSNNQIHVGFDGEVFDILGRYIDGINPNVNYPIKNLGVNNVETDRIDGVVTDTIIYLGTVTSCWGHFFTDGFSKLWWFFTDEYKKIEKQEKLKVCYVCPYKNEIATPKPWLDLINALGLDLEIMPINDLKLYKKVYVPDNSLHMMNNHRVFTNEYELTINKVLSTIKPNQNKKFENLYLSRKRWTHVNADFGERAIERLFNKVGYTSICPELYSVGEQLAMYQGAKSIVATSGSIAHNAVFCKKGTELIILRKGVGTFDYQEVVNQVKELNVIYIDCHLTLFVDENVNLGPFFMYINDNVIRFFKDRYNISVLNNFDVNQYLEYTRLCFAKDNFYRRNQIYNGYSDYYYKKLTSEIRNKKSIYRKIYDSLDRLGLSKLKGVLKKFYCKFKR